MSKFEKKASMKFGNVSKVLINPPPKISTGEAILKAIESSENDKTLKEIVNESLNNKERLYNKNVIETVIKNIEMNVEKPKVKVNYGSYNF